MTTLNTTKNTQGGFTLLELLLVIGVAALLLIGGIATYRLVSDGNRGTEATRLLLTIRQQAQTMAQQQGGNYDDISFDSATNDDTTPLVTAGVLRNQQRNPFNGPITVTPTASAGTTNDQLEIEFGNISQSQCIKMVQAINNSNEIISVTTNGGTPITTFPITAAAASTACPDAANTVAWLLP